MLLLFPTYSGVIIPTVIKALQGRRVDLQEHIVPGKQITKVRLPVLESLHHFAARNSEMITNQLELPSQQQQPPQAHDSPPQPQPPPPEANTRHQLRPDSVPTDAAIPAGLHHHHSLLREIVVILTHRTIFFVAIVMFQSLVCRQLRGGRGRHFDGGEVLLRDVMIGGEICR